MVSFESDYIAGAHPDVLKRLVETNLESLPGYGSDKYTESAKEKIRRVLGMPEADVEFIAGGTQTNAVVISTMLADYEGVIAAKTGHISAHEAGAIEYTGHEVLELPQHKGKLSADDLNEYIKTFYADASYDHMTFPGMVYISHPTEYGTLYTKKELEDISAVCSQYKIPLFLDGARLGYGLMSRSTDVSIHDIARLCDVFYIGGTKVGALCGEAVVFTKGNKPKHFLTSVKKRGALLAKGRLLGVQFDALFTDDLYYKIGRYAIDMADRLKEIFTEHGIRFFIDSPTNQQFLILENRQMKRLQEEISFSFWEKYDEDHTVVRFATSWSTTDEDLAALEEALDRSAGGNARDTDAQDASEDWQDITGDQQPHEETAKDLFRVISNEVRFGCGYRTVDGKKQYYAWHGYPNRNDDFITYAEISESEFEQINREYPGEIAADRNTADAFRMKYVTGHKILKEGWNVSL